MFWTSSFIKPAFKSRGRRTRSFAASSFQVSRRDFKGGQWSRSEVEKEHICVCSSRGGLGVGMGTFGKVQYRILSGGRVQTEAHLRALSEPAGILEETSSLKKGRFWIGPALLFKSFVICSALSSLWQTSFFRARKFSANLRVHGKFLKIFISLYLLRISPRSQIHTLWIKL